MCIPIPVALEPWLAVFRHGIAPVLTTKALSALAFALATDDDRLSSGETATPDYTPWLQGKASSAQDLPPIMACAIGYGGWMGEGLQTVAEVDDYFGRVCMEAEDALGNCEAMSVFVAAWDQGDPAVVRLRLARETSRALAARSLEYWRDT